MVLKPEFKFITFDKDGTIFKFLESGDLFEISSKDVMINLFNGNVKEGSLNSIYLRLYKNEKIFKVITLLGIKSNSQISFGENSLVFSGEEDEVKYKVKFSLVNKNVWFYGVEVFGEDVEFDILYCQDVGIANRAACITNELYVSQYIDHTILNSENGYVVCSRQNLEQGGKYPYVEHGCVNSKIISYSTDQMQFFSKEYKLTDVPNAIYKNLCGENYQYELSFVALQTERLKLSGKKEIVFYGFFNENYEERISELKFSKDVKKAFEIFKNSDEDLKKLNSVKVKSEFGNVLSSQKFSLEEVNQIYSDRKFEEYEKDELLSFFTNNNSHVVMREKEILCERPHGNIIISGISKENLNINVMASTNYMFGNFNAQVVLGNTSLNKLFSVNRGLLNVLKNSGQRIYVKIDNKFRMLTLAGMYEIGESFSKWYYKLDDDVLIVKSYMGFDSTKLCLEVCSEKGKEYEFIITNQLVMGENEFCHEIVCDFHDNKIKLQPKENSFLKNTYRDIFYEIELHNCDFKVDDDKIFFEDEVSRNKTLMTFKISKSSKFKFYVFGSFGKTESQNCEIEFLSERNKFLEFYDELVNGFKLYKEDSSNYELEKLNQIVHFYIHDFLVHFVSPHGLEQSNGAAWGTRDVCQGAVEFFMATQNYKIVREIILKIYSHQFKENGEWPQWFMFDNYNMQQDDSHGDIIFWPIKVISEYVKITGDKTIFDEKVIYRSFPSCSITEEETILNHIKRAMNSIKKRFLNGTYLISYEGGDWDDTLQPVNNLLKERLVSTWTMALAYKAIKNLSEVICDSDFSKELFEISEGIKKDFLKYAIKDGVISGFIYLNEENEIEHMIHPNDVKTKINYRLLPLIRSIISEMIGFEQACINEKVIENNLTFKDGVRLMDKTPKYNGGISKIFRRAEQASNVGREISLQYVHAHIRFVESMCKLGRSEKVWDSIFKILPIKINDSVENADYRQSNCYFSSSEGDFKTRYDFENNFSKLRSGDIKVKGGWRIYSSGPGIYINQIISNVIGIRDEFDKIVFDPVLPNHLGKVCFDYRILGKNVKIIYNLNGDNLTKIILNGKQIEINDEKNSYRNNFKSVKKEILNNELKDGLNLIEIFKN